MATVDKNFKIKNGLIVGNSTNLVNYTSASPSNPFIGQLWIDLDEDFPAEDPNLYLTSACATALYMPISASSNYLPMAASANYLTISASSNYLQVSNASVTYALLNSPTFTGTPLAPTAASGTNTTQIATTAFVNTAITNLINGAPGALDTLDELAAALGDDSNFATTVTNSLALKANLASPTLTGTPAAPTAAVGTDTTQIATTEFVNAEIANDAIVKTILDAKGDLIVASADNTPAKLTAGNNGEILFSDSSATNGLRYQPVYSTGKNKIINGDFSTWQRGTSFTTGNGVYQYTADRWQAYWYGNNTTTVSQQSFTPGSAPVAGQEGSYFLRINSTQTASVLRQLIEDVRTFAGQNIVVSFWAKAASATSVSVYANQVFGTGGSATVEPGAVNVSISSSWARYSINLSMPSISGKTIGTNSCLALHLTSGINNAVDFWGVQMESGNVATTFEQEPYAETLRKCQRYYYRVGGDTGLRFANGYVTSTTAALCLFPFPATMRVSPTALEQSGTAADYAVHHGNYTVTNCNVVPTVLSGATREQGGVILQVASGLTAGQGCLAYSNNANAYFAWSAEL